MLGESLMIIANMSLLSTMRIKNEDNECDGEGKTEAQGHCDEDERDTSAEN